MSDQYQNLKTEPHKNNLYEADCAGAGNDWFWLVGNGETFMHVSLLQEHVELVFVLLPTQRIRYLMPAYDEILQWI